MANTFPANTVPIHDDQILSRHRDNIMTSLTQRLETAKNANDFRL